MILMIQVLKEHTFLSTCKRFNVPKRFTKLQIPAKVVTTNENERSFAQFRGASIDIFSKQLPVNRRND